MERVCNGFALTLVLIIVSSSLITIGSIPLGFAQSNTNVQYFQCESQTFNVVGVDTFGVDTVGNLVSNGVGVPNAEVQFSYKVLGENTWQGLVTTNTTTNRLMVSSAGAFAFEWTPTISTYYVINVTYSGDELHSSMTAIGYYATTAFNNNQKQYIFSAFTNSTLTGLTFDPTTNEEKFSVYGTSGTGDCQVCVPKSLFPDIGTYTVMIDGAAINLSDFQSISNDYWSIHFTYNNSNHFVVIALEPTPTSTPTPTPAVPEFPTLIILPLFAVATLLSIVLIRKTTATRKDTFY
jgi:hypothetical protein